MSIHEAFDVRRQFRNTVKKHAKLINFSYIFFHNRAPVHPVLYPSWAIGSSFFYGSSSLLCKCACLHSLSNWRILLILYLHLFFFFCCCNTTLLKLHNHASQFHPVKQLSVLRAKVLVTITEFCCAGPGFLLSNWKSTMGSWLAYLSEVIEQKKNAKKNRKRMLEFPVSIFFCLAQFLEAQALFSSSKSTFEYFL